MCRDSPDMVPRLRSRSQAAPKLSQLTQGTEPAARPREARHPRKGRARQLAVPASSSPVSSPSRQSSSPVCSPSRQSSSAVGLAVLAKLKSRGPRGHREGQGPRSPSRKASPVELVVPVKASGAPGRGRRRAARHSWLPSVHLFVSQVDRPISGGLTWPDTPPAAGRAWVPGCRARTLRRPYHRSNPKSRA